MRDFEKTDLPVGWTSTRVGELYQFEYGKSLTKLSRTDAGDYPVYGSNGIVGMHDEYLIEGPVLIVGRKGAAGAVGYSPDNCWPIDTTYFIRDNPNLSLKFSYYLLQSLNLTKHEKSTAIPGLNRNDAYAEPVLLPPLPEQRRIVAKIEELFSELDKGIESFKTAREQLKVYRQALLKHAFEGKLTAKWREENKGKLETADVLLKRIQAERAERYRQQVKEWEKAVKGCEKGGKKGSKPGKPSQPKQQPPLTADELADLPQLPDGWGWTRFGLLDIDLKRGPFGSAITKKMFVPSGFKIYEQGNAIYRDCLRGNYFIDSKKYEELSGFSVSPGDLIVSCAGTVGKIYELPAHAPDGIINQALMRIRLNKTIIGIRFFTKMFESGSFQKRVLIDAKGTAMVNFAGIKELNLVPMAVCSLAEQKQVAEIIDSFMSEVDQLDQTITSALQQSETLRQSILKKAFSGQLVPQDPDDEPASKLLARIKAERSGVGAKQGVSASPGFGRGKKTQGEAGKALASPLRIKRKKANQ
jgi:type I restriction enzyme S subunit